jgi:hypothetical protein
MQAGIHTNATGTLIRGGVAGNLRQSEGRCDKQEADVVHGRSRIWERVIASESASHLISCT